MRKTEPDGTEGAGKTTSDQGRASGMREPVEVVRMMTFGAAEGGRSQGGADALTGCGGLLGSEARGRARGFSGPGGAGALRHRSRFTQLSAEDEEELKGTRGGGAEQLTVR